jgi:Flp pilus assembly protein TadG
MTHSRAGRGERGTAALETALVMGLLLMVAFGAFEWGMALRNWMTVTSGTREAARIAGAAGDTADADCLILESAAGALRNIADDQVIAIRIYRAETSGAMGPSQVYRPSADTDTAASLRCSSWFPVSQGYPEASRDNQGATRDWVGVQIEFDHDWVTGFLWWNGSVCDRGTAPGTNCWTQETIMRMEPDTNP